MSSARVLVLDVGTTALKAVVFDAAGAVLAVGEGGYGAQPAPHRQSPDAWWHAAGEAIRGLVPLTVDAIALTGTMENLIPVDADGHAVADAILYSDPCGAAAHEETGEQLAALSAGDILGNAPEPLMTVFKLVWLARHAPRAFAAAAFFLPGAKDAIALRLTGRAVTDPVTATTTGLMDLQARRWSRPLVDRFGAPSRKLPEILPSDAVVGTVGEAAAAELGHDIAGIPVINGCGDAGATTVGAACVEPGDISLYLGTSGWLARVVAASSDRVSPDPSVYRLAHPEAGRLIEITPILSAGAATAWGRDILGLSEAAAEAALAAADGSPGDLLFLPYLSGERFPFLDPDVRGGFIGLDAAHGRADLYYAILEGVAFALRANLAVLDPGGAAPLRLAGGGAQSATWPQILADVIGRPVAATESAAHVTALGAFSLAAKALGLPADYAISATMVARRPERRARADRLAAAFSRATSAARRLARR